MADTVLPSGQPLSFLSLADNKGKPLAAAEIEAAAKGETMGKTEDGTAEAEETVVLSAGGAETDAARADKGATAAIVAEAGMAGGGAVATVAEAGMAGGGAAATVAEAGSAGRGGRLNIFVIVWRPRFTLNKSQQ